MQQTKKFDVEDQRYAKDTELVNPKVEFHLPEDVLYELRPLMLGFSVILAILTVLMCMW
jgi:hypothetical protein